MKYVLLALVALLLGSSCVSTHMDKGLAALHGKKIETAFSVLGYPDSKQEFGDDTLYVWSNSRSGGMFLPTSSTSYGYVGSTPVYGTTTYNQFVPVSYFCTIKLVTDSTDCIKHWEWSGNMGGCQGYAERLRRYYTQLEKEPLASVDTKTP